MGAPMQMEFTLTPNSEVERRSKSSSTKMEWRRGDTLTNGEGGRGGVVPGNEAIKLLVPCIE